MSFTRDEIKSCVPEIDNSTRKRAKQIAEVMTFKEKNREKTKKLESSSVEEDVIHLDEVSAGEDCECDMRGTTESNMLLQNFLFTYYALVELLVELCVKLLVQPSVEHSVEPLFEPCVEPSVKYSVELSVEPSAESSVESYLV
ncbi:unnamed protein product, partial [Brenthis ino]